MHSVQGGTQKVTFNKEDSREYESLRRQAQAQADGNPYVSGIGMDVKNTRSSVYGNPNVMPEQLIEGAASNFQAGDTPGNSPMNDRLNQTGSVDGSVSATNSPQEDPQSFQSDALTERLELMRRGGQKMGLNNHEDTYGV